MFRLPLFYLWEQMENPGTKTHSLVLEVAALLNAWSVNLLSIRQGDCERLVGYLQEIPVMTCGSVPGVVAMIDELERPTHVRQRFTVGY